MSWQAKPAQATRTSAKSASGRNWFLRVEHRKRIYREFGSVIGAAGLAVYELLSLHANSITGETFLGRRAICEQSKISEHTVQNSVAVLADLKLIAIAPGRGRVPTLYTLLPLPESCDGKLPFDAVLPEHQKPEEFVVLKPQACGAENDPLRCSNGDPNKEERTVSTNRRTNSTAASDSRLDVQVREIGHLHPANAHLKQNLLPSAHESAIAEAILRDGYDLVWAGTLNLRDAVARWPPGELRYVPNVVRFYRDSEYLKDQQLWERGNGNGTNKAEQRRDGNLAARDIARAAILGRA
jgi:hypothetical protein